MNPMLNIVLGRVLGERTREGLFDGTYFSVKKRKSQSSLIEGGMIYFCGGGMICVVLKNTKGKMCQYITWVNEGHFPSKTWQDATIKTSYGAPSSNLTVGLAESKGRRLIITHIGSKEGFVSGDADVFIGGKKVEKKWTVTIFKIGRKVILLWIMLPTTPSKCRKLPLIVGNKSSIQEWLCSKNIEWDIDMLKVELLQKDAENKHLFDRYRVEDIAEKYGHTVLRLPPYNCELNPIQFIWSQIKPPDVLLENKTFKLNKPLLLPLTERRRDELTSSSPEGKEEVMIIEEAFFYL
nr:uncharacterized protein LOC122270832 [Parasteatoda tepidariorum]